MTVDQRKILTVPFEGQSAWRGPSLMDSDEWRHELQPEEVEELEEAMRSALAAKGTLLAIEREDFPLPKFSSVLGRLGEYLENGRGFFLITGLPIEKYSETQASVIYWGIGRHLGVPVSQNAAGHLLGHVRDTGKTLDDTAVRGYQTTAGLNYHADGSDVVGLLCFRPAKSGGISTIASSNEVFNEVLRQRPDLAERMFNTYYFDRRDEQPPGQDPYYAVPLACWHDGKLSNRYNRAYIESAQRFDDVPRLTEADIELFDLIDSLVNSNEFRLDMDFKPGDMQFLNNYAILHARTEYEDFDKFEDKRHLLRLWLTVFNGRALPTSFLRDPNEDVFGGRGGVPHAM